MNTNFRYEQERDSKNRQNIQEVVEYILGREYGTTLLHHELSKMLRYNIDDEIEYMKYKSVMQKIKNFLIQYGYVLKGIGGVGYYILKPSEISRHCFKTYINKSVRMYDKSMYVLERTDKDDLSDVRKEELNNLMELNRELISKTERLIQVSPYYSRKAYYDNLED